MTESTAQFRETSTGGLQGFVDGHKLTVFESKDKDGWRYNVELPNGETRWGNAVKLTKEAAAKDACRFVSRLQAKANGADGRPAPGGAARSAPPSGKSAQQAQAELSAKLKGTTSRKQLRLGSDLEIAKRVCQDLHEAFGETVFTDGKFWAWEGQYWVDLPDYLLRRAVYPYDGAVVKPKNTGAAEGAKGWEIRLGRARSIRS